MLFLGPCVRAENSSAPRDSCYEHLQGGHKNPSICLRTFTVNLCNECRRRSRLRKEFAKKLWKSVNRLVVTKDVVMW